MPCRDARRTPGIHGMCSIAAAGRGFCLIISIESTELHRFGPVLRKCISARRRSFASGEVIWDWWVLSRRPAAAGRSSTWLS